jgi:hypothetical protein
MSRKPGMFEHETFTNFFWFALLIGLTYLLAFFAPNFISHSREARLATTAHAAAALATKTPDPPASLSD